MLENEDSNRISMQAENLNDYSIELDPMGPIGEVKALILSATRNGPWNRCLFCPVYRGKKFWIGKLPMPKCIWSRPYSPSNQRGFSVYLESNETANPHFMEEPSKVPLDVRKC